MVNIESIDNGWLLTISFGVGTSKTFYKDYDKILKALSKWFKDSFGEP